MLNPSEWMRVEHYFNWVKYFVSPMNLSKERPAVLLLDNNDLYLSVAACDYCKGKRHNLQPVDEVSAAHLKSVNHACETLITYHPDNHDFLEVTRNHQHNFQIRRYSCKFQGRIFGHWHFSPYSRDIFLGYQFISS
jgi:hypothetical protein